MAREECSKQGGKRKRRDEEKKMRKDKGKKKRRENDKEKEKEKGRIKLKEKASNDVIRISEHIDSNVIGDATLNELREETSKQAQQSEGTTRTCGHTTCSNLSAVNGQKLEVALNDLGQPVGKNSKRLSSFVGILARQMVPLKYDDWRKISDETKECYWQAIKTRYFFFDWRKISDETKECYWQAIKRKFTFNGRDREAKIYTLQAMGRSARARKAKLGAILNKKPIYKSQREWDEFVKSRNNPKFKAKSEKFREMRSKQTIPYRGSRKGFAWIESEIVKEEGSICQDKVRLRCWYRAYTKKNGKAGKPDDFDLIKKVKEELASSPPETSHVGPGYEGDAYSMVFNKPERQGHLSAMGAGANPSKLSASIATSAEVVELRKKMDSLAETVKELTALLKKQTKCKNSSYSKHKKHKKNKKSMVQQEDDSEDDLEEEDSDDDMKEEDSDAQDEEGSEDDEKDHSDSDENVDIDGENDNDDDSDEEDEDEDKRSKLCNNDSLSTTNATDTPQSLNGSCNRRSRKYELLNWEAPSEVVAIGRWVTNDPEVVVHCVPLGQNASKVWVDEDNLQHRYLGEVVV